MCFKKFSSLCILIFFGFALDCGSLLFAQTATTGQITGTVKDQSGAVLPGVVIKVTDTESGLSREAFSGDLGHYAVGLLPPSTFRLEFSLSGFKTVVQEGATVRLTETTVVDVVLSIGQISQQVVVSGKPPLLQESNSTTGRVIEEKTIRELPLASRNFTQLLGLSPGTVASLPDNSAVGLNSQDISVNGADRFNNNFQLNGVDTNAIGLNNVFNYPVPAADSIQEFKVQTSLYDASYGRNAGGQIQVVTKSGSNGFHGNIYHFFRNDALNANDFFLNSTGTRRPKLLRNQFGFTFGGPIIKERTFFFGSYQGTRERNGAAQGGNISAISSLALPPDLTDDRSTEAISRASGVSVDDINPVALALLNSHLSDGSFVIPSPQVARPGVNFTASVPAMFSENQFNVNIDHQFSRQDQVSGKFFSSNNPILQGINLPPPGFGANVPGFGGRQKNNNRDLSLIDTHTFRSNLMNEARFGFHRIFSRFSPDEPVSNQSIGLSRFNDSIFPGIPSVGVLGSFQIGPSPIFELRVAINTFTYGDTLSYAAGVHNLRFGVEFRRSQENSAVDFFQRGQLLFLNFPDFVRGNIFLSLAGSGIFRRDFRNTDFSWFVQDDMKLSSKFSLNLGLRYEFDGPPSETSGRNVTFDPLQFSQGLPPNGFVVAGNVDAQSIDQRVPKGNNSVLKGSDLNNFAPRVGFAYRPSENHRFVIRSGYGIYYQRISNQSSFFSFTAPPFAAFAAQVFPTLFGTATFANPFPQLPLPGQFPVVPVVPGFNDLLSGVSPISITAIDPNLRTPYVQQFNLTLQQEFGRNFLLEIGYVGSKGTDLPRQVRINQARLASPADPVNGIIENTPLNALFRVPFLGFSPTGLVQIQSSGNSTYHSLQASLTKRYSHGFQFLASYTYSKAIDDSSTNGPDGDASPVATGNQQALFLNRGLSDFDRTQRFVLSFTYDLPRAHNASNPLAKLLSGWEVAGIATVQSGTPLDITDSAGALLFGVTTSRANFTLEGSAAAAEGQGSVNSRLNRFFDTGAFAPAGLSFGNVGRNILRGPNQRNLDLSLIKKTSINEHQNIEFRAEFFNIFNTVNFANPGTNIASPLTFGIITSTSSSPRIIQFALKYSF